MPTQPAPAPSADADDFDKDVLFADGGTLRELVQHLIKDPDVDVVPGGDRIDTVIAVVAGHAAEAAAHPRYRRWVQTVRYLEDCVWLTPEGCPVGSGFQQQRFRRSQGGRLVSWTWNDSDGPILAIHSERNNGKVDRHTWTRVHGLERVTAEGRARARGSYSGKAPREAEAILLMLAKAVC